MIDRVIAFRRALLRWWGERRVQVLHVRSIHEGYPLARRKGEVCERLVLEVNGLPSIELKYHYPRVAEDPELLRKLERQEQVCLEAADLVLTPSAVTAAHLIARGAPPAKVRVIPNGVDPTRFTYASPRALAGVDGGSPLQALYVGTLTAWQGVHRALDALALYRRDLPAELTLVGPARKRQRRELEERAQRLGIADAVRLLPPAGPEGLVALHHQADVALAPLLACDRNLVQGCCPLKVIEAMATGTPVVASDLPDVRALAEPDVEALLVRPGSAKAIKDAWLRLRGEPGLGLRLSQAARARVEREHTWERAGDALLAVYGEMLGS